MTYSRKIIFLLICTLLGLACRIHAQKEAHLVDAYRVALKGALDQNLRSLEIKGDFSIQKITLPVNILFKSPSLLKIEMTFLGSSFIQISNDSIKWELDPFQNKSIITNINNKTAGLSGSGNTFDYINYDLLNYKDSAFQLTLIRQERLDSIDTHVLELRKNDGIKTTFHINSRTNLLYKIVDNAGYRIFSNYMNEDNYVFPRFILEVDSKQTIEAHFNQLKLNLEIPDSAFWIPKAAFEGQKHEQKSIDDLFNKADFHYGRGDYDSSIICLNKILRKSPSNYKAINSRGLSKIGKKEYYDAIADFTKALELNNEGASAYNNRGLAKDYLGDKDGAIKDYSTALKYNPKLLATYRNRGILYMQNNQYDLAVEDFTNGLQVDPTNGEFHYRKGVSLAQLEKYSEAIQAYDSALKYKYASHEVHNHRGVSQYKVGDFNAAKNSFYEALVLKEDHLQYLENYGRALYELGEYGPASFQFEKYLKLDDKNPEIHNMKGLCKYQERNYKGAIKDFSQALTLKENATYFDNRALAKEMLKDFKGAIDDYSESIRVYPTDPSVFYKRGLLRFKIKKNTEGCQDLSTASDMKYEEAKEAMKKNCK